MSKLTRDGTAEPVSRDQILRRERGQRIIHFPCSAADHEQDWQPCPVVRVIHTNIVLHTHIYICKLYNNSEPCTNVHVPKKYVYWYPVYKPIQTAVLYQYIYTRYVLTTDIADHEQVWQRRSRCISDFSLKNLTRLIHITLL